MNPKQITSLGMLIMDFGLMVETAILLKEIKLVSLETTQQKSLMMSTLWHLNQGPQEI